MNDEQTRYVTCCSHYFKQNMQNSDFEIFDPFASAREACCGEFLYNLITIQRWKSEISQKGKVLEGFFFIIAVVVVVMAGGDTSQGEKKGLTEDMPRLEENW